MGWWGGADLETQGRERTERRERSINCKRDDDALEIYERGRPTEKTARMNESQRQGVGRWEDAAEEHRCGFEVL